MGRFSPTILPERRDQFGDFLGDVGEGVQNFAGARALRQRTQLEKDRLADARASRQQDVDWREAQSRLEQARFEQSQRESQARLGSQGIVTEEESGTRAPVMFGGRKTVIPDLGVGIGQQDVTKFTPNKGSFTVGGGYAYDPSRDVNRIQQLDTADRSIALKQQEQARQRAALIARGYSEADADLVVQGGVGAEKIGPLRAEGDEADIKKYTQTVLAAELKRQAGADYRDTHGPTAGAPRNAQGMTAYEAEQLKRQDAAAREAKDKADLDLADRTWHKDPVMNRPRTAIDSTHMQEADSIIDAVKKRRAAAGPGYTPLFGGGNTLGMVGRPDSTSAQPGRFAPRDSAGAAPAQGQSNSPNAGAGGKPTVQDRAQALRKAGYQGTMLKEQLQREGYAVK